MTCLCHSNSNYRHVQNTIKSAFPYQQPFKQKRVYLWKPVIYARFYDIVVFLLK